MTKYMCSVTPRAGKELNYIHDLVNGQIVVVTYLVKGERAYIRPVAGGGVHTSTVEAIDEYDDGSMTITTRNTLYSLVKVADNDA